MPVRGPITVLGARTGLGSEYGIRIHRTSLCLAVGEREGTYRKISGFLAGPTEERDSGVGHQVGSW